MYINYRPGEHKKVRFKYTINVPYAKVAVLNDSYYLELKPEVDDWLKDVVGAVDINLRWRWHDYEESDIQFRFSEKEDAVFFKIMWGFD